MERRQTLRVLQVASQRLAGRVILRISVSDLIAQIEPRKLLGCEFFLRRVQHAVLVEVEPLTEPKIKLAHLMDQ